MLEIISSDWTIFVPLFICFISLALVIILSIQLKNLKQQELIEELTNERDTMKSGPDRLKVGTDRYSYEILTAEITELLNQINSLNTNIKELTKLIKSIPEIKSDSISSQIDKLNETLQQVKTVLSSSEKPFLPSEDVLTEINVKLDNILKILSTLLK